MRGQSSDLDKGEVMSGHIIECPCGTVLRGAELDEVVATAKEHAHAVHEMDLSDDDAKAMARPSS
jgi:predicted small metal-binding protein